MKRGDVIVVRFPHPSGLRGKKRPAVVIQSDAYSVTIKTIVIAEVTTNLSMADDPACLLVRVNTPEGAATGLAVDSVITCLYLSTTYADQAERVLGSVSQTMMSQIDNCLKAALALP